MTKPKKTNNIVSIPREILIDILLLLNSKSLSNLSKTCKFFYEFCKLDSFWLKFCKEFGIDKLGNYPNFLTMYTGILYKYGWLIGYWAGNKPINGSLLIIEFDPYKSSIIAWRITATSFDKHNESVLWKQQDDDDEYGNEQTGFISEEEEIDNTDTDEVDTTIFGQESTIENQNCFLFEDEKYFKFWTLNDRQKEKKKFDGIWVGDYGSHGIEFILFREDDISGYLIATKITGDINVPRGEISWRCNLKDQVRICDEKEWNGKVSYRAKTKVAFEGFRNPDEIDSEVIVITYDKLVVYWYDLSEMATFVRVS
ncbi:3359_t:CDS:2 [Funneliformis mosseae]|uniref:3359_t:CDS:1 n=1 Tax=Funneliformis mosseae TaxID=27381 RepID=A0A9N8WP58_FUNMO|nr:3359_t:CDS:2 [Funneliformis mosseae]